MSRSPPLHLSKLSLQSTPSPAAQSGSPMQQPSLKSRPEYGSDDDESDWEDEDDNGDTVTSPTGLRYKIGHLARSTQRVVRGLFNDQEPPQIYLESCGIKEEEDSPDSPIFYAFQMHEVVPCSVRIGSRESTRWSMPRCTCPDATYHGQRPCKHLVWLFDRISKQALLSQSPSSEFTLGELGYPEELGDPYRRISELRLDILADGLHTDMTSRNGDTASPSKARIREAREMVAALAGVQAHEVESFRPDLNKDVGRDNPIRRGDLEATLFSLILASHSLAASIRARLDPSDPVVDPFRAIQQHAQRVISEMDSYSSSLQNPALMARRRAEGREAEGPRDGKWAATQIRNCVSQVERLVLRGSRPLAGPERASAARALVGILKLVASHSVEQGGLPRSRDLYMRLIGNQDNNFVYSALDTLVDQSQFVEELELVMELVGRFGAPESYVSNMRGLIKRMRSHTGEDSRRPSVAFSTDSAPRTASPTLEGVPPVGPQPESVSEPASGRPSSSGSGRFLTPEVPASATRARARSDRGRRRAAERSSVTSPSRTRESSSAGLKRQVSGSGAQEGAKGSKRPR
ncbi:hypothetical protein QBC47DRAFT_210736 [Echria macrotheca]|uniref:SWIM-type domain-containing protein n=1 Tax=Echria macrotheca TaxID=438768 RepID=A0AAJ0BC74_9PEZI|nr:hypothetical protein QBC47DRAFT_210736 [Echria macrotheca]